MSTKKSFYPVDEVEKYLEQVPKGQISSRINDLILKGLSLERQKLIEEEYRQFNARLAEEPPRKKQGGISTTMMMSAKAFEPEDEVEDFF